MRTYQCIVKKYFPQGASLGEVLIKMTKLEIDILKLATLHGAVWIQFKGIGKIDRLRNIREKIAAEDKVWLYLDPKVLELPPFENPELIEEFKHYGVWWKPAGVLSQGTQTGDHRSLLRAIELEKKKQVYLVHRLDRETAGIMLYAYSSEGARELSALMGTPKIKKIYQAISVGDALATLRPSGVIEIPLDGKIARTFYEVIKVDEGLSYFELEIETGRLHQVRQHLAEVGLPILGDPAYGKGNKNKDGLKLVAHRLVLSDPWTYEKRAWVSPQSLF
jgi:tRNA pseudouridine32 synthase/23S rRNA pseudouridine746 synthase